MVTQTKKQRKQIWVVEAVLTDNPGDDERFYNKKELMNNIKVDLADAGLTLDVVRMRRVPVDPTSLLKKRKSKPRR